MRFGRRIISFCVGAFLAFPGFLHAGGIGPISPSNLTVSGEVEFEISVEARDISNLFGVSYILTFDPNYLHAISETQGSFFGNDVIFFAQEDNNLGKISVGISKKAGQQSANGTGEVLRVRFLLYRSVLPGQVDLTFSLTELSAIDASGNPMSLNTWSSVMAVYPFSSAIESDPNGLTPTRLTLSQNYPNPFNAETMIRYTLPEAVSVTLKLYDSLGQEIKILVSDFCPAGEYAVRFDANALPSGQYLYRLQSGNSVLTRHLLLLK